RGCIGARGRRCCLPLGGVIPVGSLLGGLHDLDKPPVLGLRERSCLDDANDVADVRRVLRVVRVELDAVPDDLLVPGMRLDRVDLDDDRLVHRAGDDDASTLLSAPTLGFGLRSARDRLALGRLLTAWPRTLPAFSTRNVLALLLRLRSLYCGS